MNPRTRPWRFLLVALLCLFTGFVWTAGTLGSTGSSDQVTHEDGSTCPDSDNGHAPCGPVCPCTCCPGHGALAAAFAPADPGLAILAPRVHEVVAPPPEDLHPEELSFGIFHPPRA
jgi:hypothetical protein